MADYYTLLTTAGIAYETACKAAGVPIKLAQISVGDGNGAVYNPDANAKALKREVWRGPLNSLFQDAKNSNWLLAEVTIPSEVGGWYVREAGIWTDTGILYAIVKYPESYKPLLTTSGAGKEFYIRSIFETSNASNVTLLIDDTVVKATRAWVMDYLGQQLAKKAYTKPEVDALIAKASAALAPLAAQASETNQGTAKIATQAQVDQGGDDSAVLTPKKLRWGFQILKAPQGYVVFPTWLGGLILQWGYSQIPAVPTNVQFPLSYPGGCFSVVATPFNVTGGADVIEFFQPPTKSSFMAVGVSSGATGAAFQPATSFFWLSVGY